jgi:HD superfamily phosphohydrolase YqeK
MAQTINIAQNKERFCQILRDTKRENIDYVIEDLEALGFFEAPASVKNHYNFAGGLVEHSLKVYDMAMALRESIVKMRPDMESQLPLDSIAISTLLHDVCKADIYRTVQRARKNEIGIYEKFEEYTVDYSKFPVGHGEKSVIMLLRSGLDLEDEEIFAIRWHMGAWELAQQSIEQERSYRTAQQRSPLVALVHSADTLSAQILERDA